MITRLKSMGRYTNARFTTEVIKREAGVFRLSVLVSA